MRLIAEQPPGVVVAVAFGENVEVEPACQRIENAIHLAEYERNLVHVLAAHVLGQTGGGRLLPDEVVGCLRAVSER